MDTERQVYSVTEAGRVLGLSKNSAYEAVRKGQIPSIRIGGKLIVPKLALDRMLAGEAAG
jgi:excisionase family DNA binding protein